MDRTAAVYIHIPFCERKCFYCSFPVSVGSRHRIDEYLDALEWEARQYRGIQLTTVYIGGGTPTILSVHQLMRLMAIIRDNFLLPSGTECTIEANPETITPEKIRALIAHGVNRLSLGVQSLNSTYLLFLGRAHNRACAISAFNECRHAGCGNINVDLMYSFPGQTRREIEEDVAAIAALGSEHLSLYTLDVEHGSRFYARQLTAGDERVRVGHYRFVIKRLADFGFHQYEVSNFAKPGAESRHNMIYWRGGEYIGLGLGAHSYLNGERFWNSSRLAGYFSAIRAGTMPIEGRERLSPERQVREALLINLRMAEGANLGELERRFQCPLSDEAAAGIEKYICQGFLIRRGPRLAATPRGMLVLDEICARLI